MAFSPQDHTNRPGFYRPQADINVTPLVDVMLVLLIIFMVTAPLLTPGVKVDLPKAASAKALNPKAPLIVSVGVGSLSTAISISGGSCGEAGGRATIRKPAAAWTASAVAMATGRSQTGRASVMGQAPARAQ